MIYSIFKQEDKTEIMKKRRNIIALFIIGGLVVAMVARLMANKESFERDLRLISESVEAVPVVVDTVKIQSVNTEFLVDGIFSAFKETSIAAELEGKVGTVGFNIGDEVSKGQVLATINNEVYKSQLELARYTLDKAEKDMQRNEQLIKADGITMQQFEDAKENLINAQANVVSAQKQYDDSFIKAPFSGVITRRYIENGAYLSQGAKVFDMVTISKVKLQAMVTAEQLIQIQKGGQVNVFIDIYPESCFKGMVTAINAKADESGKYEVEISVDNSSEKNIKPGMFGSASFQGISLPNALVISRRTIAGSIKNAEVFCVKGDSVTLQKIDVKPLQGEDVLVTKGLKAGDIIVSSGQINLVAGSKIKIL